MWSCRSLLRRQRIKLVFSIPPHRPTPNIAPSWNVAPTDPVPVIRCDAKAGERSSDVMRWGPSRRSGRRSASRISTGKTAVGKQPNAITLAKRGLMALAGLWETWRSPAGERVRSFAIITTTPNELCGELHLRMPVVLGPQVWPEWLGEEPADVARLKALLTPYTAEEMTCWPVSTRVGNVKNNDPSLIDLVALAG